MRLLCITDLHGNLSALGRILDGAADCDLVLLGGDLTTFGTPDDAERIVRRAQTAGPQVLAVAGNCDSAEIDRRLTRLGVALHGRGVVVEGVGLHGLSAMPPWRHDMYQFTEAELARFLEDGRGQIDTAEPQVVLSHPPPQGILDRTGGGSHVGSTAEREFVDRRRPALLVCGHIHESRGIERHDATTVVNCGAATAGQFAVVDVGDDGVRAELRQV